jgi:hypothetical protein
MARYAKVWVMFGIVAVLPSYIGCDSSADTGAGQSMDEVAAQLDAQNAAQQQADSQAEAERKAQESQQAAQPADEQRTLAGRPGVGEGGYYTAIVGARRHVLNQVDRLSWLTGVKNFQATEGRLPKDHAEFMSRVVEPDGIDLGYKEENQEFLYDPTAGPFGEVYVVEKEPAQ